MTPRLIVEILSRAPRPDAPRRAVLAPGDPPTKIGRSERAQIMIAHDPRMAGAHFTLAWDGAQCTLESLDHATGTLLNGAKVERAAVAHGDWIRAADTDFAVWIEGTSRADTPAPTPRHEAVLRYLRECDGDLYAVLDSARAPRVLALLADAVDESQSLYEGLDGDLLSRVAPYLVKLQPSSRLLDALVIEGWGKSWGIYLSATRPFREVRRHLRRFLLVEDPSGKEVYFRYYDPRVLTRFLPTCTTRQSEELFGDVRRFCAESRGGDSIQIYRPGSPVTREALALP